MNNKYHVDIDNNNKEDNHNDDNDDGAIAESRNMNIQHVQVCMTRPQCKGRT